MATAVFFHAHPDDEAIATGGTMAMLSDIGHRVVLVIATRGEEGEVDDGLLEPGETLGQRREREAWASVEFLGVARLEFLGYRDSGMMGTPTNDSPGSFWQADVDKAAARLAAILEGEEADVLTVYDDHGAYGHPDHIQVHRVGHQAALLAGTQTVYESTINRDHVRRIRKQASQDPEGATRVDVSDEWIDRLGLDEAQITTAIDVRAYLDRKRRAMLAHASQLAPDSWFVSMDDARFAAVWGREWFRRTTPPFEGELPRDREDLLL